MTSTYLDCRHCGIANKHGNLRCVACERRLDLPTTFKKKEDVYAHFSRGGFSDIAEGLGRGAVTWDPGDDEYTRIVESAVLLALEESFSTLDVLFYGSHPTTDGPYLGIRWPKSELLKAIQVSFIDDGGEEKYTIIERSKAKDVGENFRFDGSLGKHGMRFEIRLITVYDKSAGPNKKYETPSIGLRPIDPTDSHTLYELFRKTTGNKVK